MSATLSTTSESSGATPPLSIIRDQSAGGLSWEGRDVTLLSENDKGQLILDLITSKEPKEKVGSGCSSDVYKRMYKGCRYAVKLDNGKTSLTYAEREAAIGPLLDHPHIVRHHGCAKDYPQYLIMDYIDGDDIEEPLVREHFTVTVPDETERRLNNCKIVGSKARSALAYLHGRGYVYRDLKGSNVRVKIVNGIVVNFTLLDLGMVRHTKTLSGLPPDQTDKERSDLPLSTSLMEELKGVGTAATGRNRLSRFFQCCSGFCNNSQPQPKSFELTICGSTPTISPEMLQGIYTTKADSWAFGALLYFLLEGKYPFKGKNILENLDNIRHQPLVLSDSLPEQAKNLLVKLLSRAEDVRPYLAEIEDHPFFVLEKPCLGQELTDSLSVLDEEKLQ